MLTTMLILFLITCDSAFTKGSDIVSTFSQIPFATSMYSFFIILQKFSLLRDMPSGLCAFQLSPWLACTNLTPFIHGEITAILWTPTLVILDATESQHGLRLSWDEDSDPSDLWRQYPRENQVKEWERQGKREILMKSCGRELHLPPEGDLWSINFTSAQKVVCSHTHQALVKGHWV